jgi:chemotaxis response regulator CheB
MKTLKIIFSFLKTHWYIPVVVIIGLLAKSKSDSLLKIIDAQKETYEKEKMAIETAAEEKVKAKQKVQEEYEDAVTAIERVRESQNKKLEAKSKKEIKKIVKKHYNEPDKISKEISDLFGLTYVPKKRNNSD